MVQELNANDNNQLSQETSHKGQNNLYEFIYIIKLQETVLAPTVGVNGKEYTEINHVKPIQIHHVRSFQSAQKYLNYVVAPISPNPSSLQEKSEQLQQQSFYTFSSKVCPLVSNFPKT